MADKEYGITENGFKAKPFSVIREEYRELLSQIKDPKTNESFNVDFDSDDVLTQIINNAINQNAELWQMAEFVYSQFNPNLATNEALTSLAQINGILRKTGQPSYVEIQYTGNPGVRIPAGSKISDENKEVVWQVTSNITLNSKGVGVGLASSIDNGVFRYGLSEINQMLDLISGVQAVINISPSYGGAIDEPDYELRKRRNSTLLVNAKNSAESIYAAVANIDAVVYCKLYNNYKAVIDEETGIPANSICLVVQGGEDIEIAKQIFDRKSPEVGTYGDSVVSFTDSLGEKVEIKFQRPIEVSIRVRVDISVDDENIFPANYQDMIRQNIIDYARDGVNGLGIDAVEGFEDYGFPPGKDIVASKLYTAINKVPGLKINQIQLAKYDKEESLWTDYSTNDIVLSWNQIGLFLKDNITVQKI